MYLIPGKSDYEAVRSTGQSSDEEDPNNDDDEDETIEEEDVDKEFLEEDKEDMDIESSGDDGVDEESVDEESAEEDDEAKDDDGNSGFNGGDSDDEENGEDFLNSFDGTAQCVKVIDNMTTGFPSVGKTNSKSKYVPKPLFALILTPTRELAVQISQHLKAASKYTTISVSVVVGGLSSQKQERLLNRGPEIVIATPGRLWELIEEGHPHLIQVDTLKCVRCCSELIFCVRIRY